MLFILHFNHETRSHKCIKHEPAKSLITARVAKVMFSQASVILSTLEVEGVGGVCLTTPTPLPEHNTRPSPGTQHLPPPPTKEAEHQGIRSMRGRYASYWNAFLFISGIILKKPTKTNLKAARATHQ